jgi:hypothetical protein
MSLRTWQTYLSWFGSNIQWQLPQPSMGSTGDPVHPEPQQLESRLLQSMKALGHVTLVAVRLLATCLQSGIPGHQWLCDGPPCWVTRGGVTRTWSWQLRDCRKGQVTIARANGICLSGMVIDEAHKMNNQLCRASCMPPLISIADHLEPSSNSLVEHQIAKRWPPGT